ncbi:DUF397 domain-containing protein [Actinomadura atramentaria]|uniref:DUF397 domain-containing protein n=1 Tax=Actinomadura atramentaria TaxID=1990 RepID=UPI0003A5C2AF|nr:DUF397 domain-containing protein [Actinomadura atramentaria]
MTRQPASPPNAKWRKSTRSNNGGDCVELRNTQPAVDIRDSKDSDGPTIALPRSAWIILHTHISSGALDL